MRKIKKFENFYYDPSYDYTYANIDQICQEYGITNYTLNDRTGKVDVQGNVNLSRKNITELPLEFGIVTGNFNCSDNQLTYLEGAPEKVGRDFDCRGNNLTSLVGAPEEVGGDFNCKHNRLKSLSDLSENLQVYGSFYCEFNNLTSLFNIDSSNFSSDDFKTRMIELRSNRVVSNVKVGFDFNCSNNELTSLTGAPGKVGRNFYCSGNRAELERPNTIIGGEFINR